MEPLKVLIIGKESAEAIPVKTRLEKNISNLEMINVVAPGEEAKAAMQLYEFDIVVMSCNTALQMNSLVECQARSHIAARTRQGVQLVDIKDIDFFQAEHKYVVLYYEHGALLIDDSIAELEKEFHNKFIRIHRKTLVAIAKIDFLGRNVDGHSYITLKGRKELLWVSRRQLTKVKRILVK